jgi:hypothetical protein
MARCSSRRCTGKIVFEKPVPKGKTPKGQCVICGQKYIAAYDCNGKLKLISVD